MKMAKTAILGMSAVALFLSACVQEDGTTNKIAVGAGTGAVLGGIVGRVTAGSNDKAQNTALGAAVGGAVGAFVGNELEKQEAELRTNLSGTGASIVNTGSSLIVTLPEAITFATGSATVKSSLYSPLAQIATSLNSYPSTIAQVVGHTDSVGDASYNQTLSVSRANSVASILISSGTPSSRVTVVGRGETTPVATNDTDAGRQANRRVEINIIPTS